MIHILENPTKEFCDAGDWSYIPKLVVVVNTETNAYWWSTNISEALKNVISQKQIIQTRNGVKSKFLDHLHLTSYRTITKETHPEYFI